MKDGVGTYTETLVPPPDRSCSYNKNTSEDETQHARNPDETQFSQPVDTGMMVSQWGNLSCQYNFYWEDGGVTMLTDGTLVLYSNRPPSSIPVRVDFRVRRSKYSREVFRAILVFHSDDASPTQWEAVTVTSPTEDTPHVFVRDLSLTYVGLADTELHLKFMRGGNLRATLTNTLKGPTTHQVMVFECVPMAADSSS